MNTGSLFEERAIIHAKTCFFNSLLREWTEYERQDGHICLRLNPGEDLLLPLKHFSSLGRHEYKKQTFLRKSGALHEISFDTSVDLVCDFLTKKLDSLPAKVEQFKARVRDSLRNTDTFLSFRKELSELNLNFKDGEQGLLVGHNFHPTPKSREQFSNEDMYKYSPELNGQFKLAWFLVDPTLLYQHSSNAFNSRRWLHELARDEIPTLNGENSFVPVPMHPWQKHVLLKRKDMQSYMRDGRIRECDESTKVWHATSSLRSVYREDADFMLKFSISLRLTNSIRHLLFHEVERGQQLHDVLATPTGQRFLREHPSFQMMSEPAFVAFKDEQGLPLSESIVVCRENPFQNTVARNKVVLATLTQDHPFGGLNLIQRLILSSTVEANQSLRTRARLWFDGFLKASVAPILAAHANYGIVLGAHQQNLILDLQNGYPVGSFFRDCQGTGYTELGWSLFAEDVPLLSKGNGNILGEDMGNWLLSYYVILNSTFNVITALSQNDWIQEEELLADLKDCLGRLLAKGVRDESCLRYLLYEKKGLMHKGNFLCSFKNMNENTIDDPLAIYTRVPNPLAPFERRNHA